jgi:hypothetical protein
MFFEKQIPGLKHDSKGLQILSKTKVFNVYWSLAPGIIEQNRKLPAPLVIKHETSVEKQKSTSLA